MLAVEDAGPGIPEAERQRIFDRFTQLERSQQRRSGGVGLGLYIARQLARSQDGDLLLVDPASGRERPLRAPPPPCSRTPSGRRPAGAFGRFDAR